MASRWALPTTAQRHARAIVQLGHQNFAPTETKSKKGTGDVADPLVLQNPQDGLFSGLRHWQNRNKGAALEALVELYGAFRDSK